MQAILVGVLVALAADPTTGPQTEARFPPLVVPMTREQYRAGGSRYPLPPKLFSHSDQAAVVQTSAGQGGGGTGHGARLLNGAAPANAHPLLSAISVGSRTEGLLSGLGYAPYQMTPSGAICPSTQRRRTWLQLPAVVRSRSISTRPRMLCAT